MCFSALYIYIFSLLSCTRKYGLYLLQGNSLKDLCSFAQTKNSLQVLTSKILGSESHRGAGWCRLVQATRRQQQSHESDVTRTTRARDWVCKIAKGEEEPYCTNMPLVLMPKMWWDTLRLWLEKKSEEPKMYCLYIEAAMVDGALANNPNGGGWPSHNLGTKYCRQEGHASGCYLYLWSPRQEPFCPCRVLFVDHLCEESALWFKQLEPPTIPLTILEGKRMA